MSELDKIAELYADYLEQVAKMERELKPGQGMFGLGVGPRNHPCHGEFTGVMEGALAELAGAGLPSAELRAVLEFIYRAPLAHKVEQRSEYWMLMAVHNMTLPLVGGLSAGDAAALRAQYEADYPRRDRLPAQNNVLAALKKQMK